jgi:thiol-disulfide isomerase/thioredoxin
MNKLLLVLAILILALVLLRMLSSMCYSMGYEGFAGANKTLVIAKAEWCGHCKTAAPEFEKLQKESPIKLKSGTEVPVKILDSDKNKDEIATYKIKGFPSIMVVDGENITEYHGPRTKKDIITFLESNY